jgi:hypothetical protein
MICFFVKVIYLNLFYYALLRNKGHPRGVFGLESRFIGVFVVVIPPRRSGGDEMGEPVHCGGVADGAGALFIPLL